jgi:hypothetical protein
LKLGVTHAAHRAVQPHAARGSAQPLHLSRREARPARVPGVRGVLQSCAAITGVACDTGAVPGVETHHWPSMI